MKIHGPIILVYAVPDRIHPLRMHPKGAFRRSVSLFADPYDNILEHIFG